MIPSPSSSSRQCRKRKRTKEPSPSHSEEEFEELNVGGGGGGGRGIIKNEEEEVNDKLEQIKINLIKTKTGKAIKNSKKNNKDFLDQKLNGLKIGDNSNVKSRATRAGKKYFIDTHTHSQDKDKEGSGIGLEEEYEKMEELIGNGNGIIKNLEQEEEEDDDTQPLFIEQYTIVKTIFTKLPIKDLLSVAKVCKVFSEISRIIRNKRVLNPTPSHLFFQPYIEETKRVVDLFLGTSSPNNNSNNNTNGSNNNNNNGTPPTTPTTKENLNFVLGLSPPMANLREGTKFATFLHEKYEQTILKQFAGSFYESQFILFFATTSFYFHISRQKRIMQSQLCKDNGIRVKRSDLVFTKIKEAVPCLAAIGYGIVANDCSLPDSTTFEMEDSKFPMVSCLAIPKVPGLYIKSFCIESDINLNYKNINKDNCVQLLNISPNDKVKAIVVFDTGSNRGSVLTQTAIFHYLKEHPNVAMGGGIMDKTLISYSATDVPYSTGLIICGDESVKVASFGMFKAGLHKTNLENLAKVKNTGNFESDSSFAFMFACNGRGYSMHSEVNVESSLFLKNFPKTKLIGAFTGGEYCHSYLPGEISKAPSRRSNLLFGYSTIFLLVSYNNINTE